MPAVHVTVRLSGPLAERLGHRLAVELAPGASVSDLLGALGLGEPGGSAADSVAVVAAGTIVPHDRALADGDEVDVLVPVAGG